METEMSDDLVYVVINGLPDPAKMALLQTYVSKIVPIFVSHGGRQLSRYRAIEQLLGENGPTLTAIFEFPNETAVKTMMKSAEFLALGPMRKEVYRRLDVMLCGAQ
jgi:uncharacterized protein (DUF1330 family)